MGSTHQDAPYQSPGRGWDLFENAYSHSPLTLPSHWSNSTGTYPFVHGIKENAFFSTNSNIVNLAQILKGEGYSTARFCRRLCARPPVWSRKGF